MVRAFGLWFYLLPDNTLRAWQGGGVLPSLNDPIVTTVSPSVYTTPALLHDALPSGDPALYALTLTYGFYYNPLPSGYWFGALVPGSKWFLASVPNAMLPISPYPTPTLPAVLNGVWGRHPTPVLSRGAFGTWDDGCAYYPRLIRNLDGTPYRDASGYYYWYYIGSSLALINRDQSGLARATSLDARVWERVGTGPVIPRGVDGSLDGGDAQVSAALFDGTTFHVWYDANANVDPAKTDEVSIAYCSGTDPSILAKQGVVIPSIPGEDYYGENVFKDGASWGMVVTRHIPPTYGAIRLDAPTIAGPWTQRPGFYFTHPSGQAFVSGVRVTPMGTRLLYTSAAIDGIRSAFAPLGGVFTDLGMLLGPSTGLWDFNPYNGDSLLVDGVEHLYYNADPYAAGGIGHAFAPTI